MVRKPLRSDGKAQRLSLCTSVDGRRRLWTRADLAPLRSMSIPTDCTLILPFNEVPSNVPEKTTSDGEPSMVMLIVKLNLSPLREPLTMLAVPRLPLVVPKSVPSVAIVTSSIDSSAPSGVVYFSVHFPVRSPFGGSLAFSGSRMSKRRPSTNTYLILVFSLNRSPSATTRLAIFPFSMKPAGPPRRISQLTQASAPATQRPTRGPRRSIFWRPSEYPSARRFRRSRTRT